MIMVTGVIVAKPDAIDALVEASLAHVHRSRTEPGCLSHHVHVDVENPLRLVFLEQWSDRAALDEHVRQPGSAEFVGQIEALATERPRMEIFTVPDA